MPQTRQLSKRTYHIRLPDNIIDYLHRTQTLTKEGRVSKNSPVSFNKRIINLLDAGMANGHGISSKTELYGRLQSLQAKRDLLEQEIQIVANTYGNMKHGTDKPEAAAWAKTERKIRVIQLNLAAN